MTKNGPKAVNFEVVYLSEFSTQSNETKSMRSSFRPRILLKYLICTIMDCSNCGGSNVVITFLTLALSPLTQIFCKTYYNDLCNICFPTMVYNRQGSVCQLYNGLFQVGRGGNQLEPFGSQLPRYKFPAILIDILIFCGM